MLFQFAKVILCVIVRLTACFRKYIYLYKCNLAIRMFLVLVLSLILLHMFSSAAWAETLKQRYG